MLTYMARRYADGQAGARAVLSSSSIFCSPSLTRTACHPMNPPSLAASAARWAHSSSHSEKAWVSSGVAFAATMPRTRESSSRICLPARPAESGLKPLTGFWCRSAISLTVWATSPTRSLRPSWIVVPTTLTTAPVSLTTSMGPPGSASVIAVPATRGARTMADHSSSLNSAFPVMGRRYQQLDSRPGRLYRLPLPAFKNGRTRTLLVGRWMVVLRRGAMIATATLALLAPTAAARLDVALPMKASLRVMSPSPDPLAFGTWPVNQASDIETIDFTYTGSNSDGTVLQGNPSVSGGDAGEFSVLAPRSDSSD